jgi:MFS family permease
MTISVVAIVIFTCAFFGSSLLFPQYFQQVRLEKPLQAGILLAPQGLGAMITMPIAGVLADKLGSRWVVLPGVALILVSLGMYATLDESTSYWFLLSALFIMGLGMGCTMMPLFSAAMATLREHTIARGSTLINIVQQISASIGTALFSVLLTNSIQSHVSGNPASLLHETSKGYASSFLVATICVAVVLVPAFFLPKKGNGAGASHAPMH